VTGIDNIRRFPEVVCIVWALANTDEALDAPFLIPVINEIAEVLRPDSAAHHHIRYLKKRE